LEDINMHTTVKTFALATAAFCATAAFAANRARVDVPFNFTAMGQSYPAGSYDVATDLNHNFVTMVSNVDATKHITWTVKPAEPVKAPAVVTFDEVGADYSLKTIQIGQRVTPNLDKGNKRGVSATTSISGQ
jgi:hypothetical protein